MITDNWTSHKIDNDLNNARLVNEEHKRLNGNLIEENKLLRETLYDMYELISRMDLGNPLHTCYGDPIEYDSIPWEKWKTIIDYASDGSLGIEPIQLRLF